MLETIKRMNESFLAVAGDHLYLPLALVTATAPVDAVHLLPTCLVNRHVDNPWRDVN